MAEPDRFHVLSELRPWLLIRARTMSYDNPDAEDLVQEVLAKFVSTFEKAPVPPPAACRAYLATALQNEFISRLRKQKVRNQISSPLDETEEGQWLPPPSAFDRPSYETVDDDDVKHAMARLTDKQRAVIEMVFAGRRYKEIGQALGIVEGTVAKRAFDARERLRQALAELRRASRARGASER